MKRIIFENVILKSDYDLSSFEILKEFRALKVKGAAVIKLPKNTFELVKILECEVEIDLSGVVMERFCIHKSKWANVIVSEQTKLRPSETGKDSVFDGLFPVSELQQKVF